MRTDIPLFELDSYQRAARTVLSHHVITAVHPDRFALPLVRRWAGELRDDLLELFGYRLDVTETVARLHPVIDRFDASRPARTRTDRPFDGRRYAYLCLFLVALGRAGEQMVLSELVDRVVDEATAIDGLSLDPDLAADRHALVDVVGWLVDRGAMTIADGDTEQWARDPGDGEALFDIDRTVVAALTHIGRWPGYLTGAADLLGEFDPAGVPDPESARGRQAAARAVRRALVERPLVAAAEFDRVHRRLLYEGVCAEQVARLTGLTAEARAEGVAMIDTTGRLSDGRFPSTGTVAQVALLLANDIAERVLDPENPLPTVEHDPERGQRRLRDELDAALPRDREPFPEAGPDDGIDTADVEAPTPAALPKVDDGWITETVAAVIATYGRTFAAQWADDPGGLRTAAIDLLERFDLVIRVPGGLLIRPTLARYRGVVVTVRDRAASVLFSTGLPDDPTAETPPADDPPPGDPATATTTATDDAHTHDHTDDAEEIE